MIKTQIEKILSNQSIRSTGTIESDKSALNEVGKKELDTLKEYLLILSDMKKNKYLYLSKSEWEKFRVGELALPRGYTIYDIDSLNFSMLGVSTEIFTADDVHGKKQKFIDEDTYFSIC